MRRSSIILLIGVSVVVLISGIIAIIIFKPKPQYLENECYHKNFGKGSTVCICNDNHCDTLPPIKKVNSSAFVVYTTSKSGLRFHKQTKSFGDSSFSLMEDVCEKEVAATCGKVYNPAGAGADEVKARRIIINSAKEYQKVLGWGGSFTDAAGINIRSLNQKLQNDLMRAYFSEDGLEYKLGRVPIGGADFSTRKYTYDETEDNSVCDDPLLTRFSLAEEDYKYKIPIINEAKKLAKTLNLVSATWSIPVWMKENKDYMGMMGYPEKKYYQSLANYLVKFLEAYKQHNITFWGISTGNEPIFAMAQGVKLAPGTLYSPHELNEFTRSYFGPTLRNSTFSDIRLLAFDDFRALLPHSIQFILPDEETLKYVDGIAVHWYYDSEANSYILDDVHNKYPDKFILYTESCTGYIDNTVRLGCWQRGEDYARNIIEDMNHWVTGWIDWNLALDMQGGPNVYKNFVDAPIIVDSANNVFYKQPMYYVLGHFSKFVPPDSVRIYSTQCGSEVPVVAFKRPDGGIVVVVLNTSNKIQRRSIVDSIRGEIELDMSPRSISTIIYW
ncbi:unnamed protein product [Phyllotreta striolata]|uniref:Glucosylceramidase n=1 Tax=Phyllotreta striolata TaxID=444603 RepID=A0A9N9XHU9_PHYSR|nr:unnamed protein product [Phyllotreta striolata]